MGEIIHLFAGGVKCRQAIGFTKDILNWREAAERAAVILGES